MSSQPVLYEFVGSCWANVPKIALTETGYKDGDVKFESINLAEGANFNPEYLKINPAGTVPALTVDGKTYTDTITVVSQLIKRAPHPPKTDAGSSTTIVDVVHKADHDPNATLLSAKDDADREAKIKGLAKGFLEGRQKALDKYAPEAPAEFKEFLEKKQAGNREFLQFYTGNPDEATKQKVYANTNALWKSAGETISGPLTVAIKKTGGPFVNGGTPAEADYHVITWLSRIISNAGVEPGSPASTAIPKLEKYSGSSKFDDVIYKYWDEWIARESFKKNHIQ